jgi:hypothetical protein
MSFTQADVNEYNFSEVKSNDKQALVTNNLGRTALQYELVYLGGFFGEVLEYGGIANSETGYINFDSDRVIRTQQIEATTTFTVGSKVYFVPGGSSAAGKLYGVETLNGFPVGVCIEEEGTGGAQTSVTFRPYAQNNGDAKEVKQYVYKVTTGAAAIVVPGLKQGDEIIDVMIIPTGASTNGTIKITNGTNDITDAMTCAVDKTIDRAATIDDAYSTLPAAGARIVCAGDTVANTKAIVVFTYIPA